MSRADYSGILCLSFNQDRSCLQGGTESGFFMFNTEPFSQGTWRGFTNGGVAIVELLYRTNIVALVGGGHCPQFPVNKVMLWDDSKRKCVGEVSFHTAVKAVRVRKDVLVVALEKRIYVYNFAELKMLNCFDTSSNANGICALSLELSKRVLAFPGAEKGMIKVEHLAGTIKSVTVQAHETELVALALDNNGDLVASASERGTLIRVFDTNSGDLLYELRRGADRAYIYSLAFDSNAEFLACSSDKSTIHVFSVQGTPIQHESNIGATQPDESPSTFVSMAEQAQGMIKDLLPKYFTADVRRSVVRFQVQDTYTVCAFGSKPNTILVAGLDGNFSQFAFDPATGASERLFFGSVLSTS